MPGATLALHPRSAPPDRTAPRRHDRVLDLLRLHGWNATSFQVLEPGLRHFFAGQDACVAYVDTGEALVAAGAPIAPDHRIAEVAARFADFARRAGRRVRFFAVVDRFLARTDLAATPIGEQPAWDPGAWGEVLARSRSLREQLRRARARGVSVRRLAPGEIAAGPTRAAVEALVRRWLATRRMAPMGFLVEVHLFSFLAERRLFVAERAGRVVALLAAVPIYARDGFLFEDLIRDPAAPNGTSELLIDCAMREAACEGSSYVTLGLAPLAGVSGWLAGVKRVSRRLYDFEGLAAFKARLRPQAWEPVYLAHPRRERGVRAVADSLTAFARGSLLRFGLQTIVHASRRRMLPP